VTVVTNLLYNPALLAYFVFLSVGGEAVCFSHRFDESCVRRLLAKDGLHIQSTNSTSSALHGLTVFIIIRDVKLVPLIQVYIENSGC